MGVCSQRNQAVKKHMIGVESMSIVGDIAKNEELRALLRAGAGERHGIPVLPECGQDALEISECEKIGWMCWELINADEHVDLCQLDPSYSAVHAILPLGNYFEEMTNQQNKVVRLERARRRRELRSDEERIERAR